MNEQETKIESCGSDRFPAECYSQSFSVAYEYPVLFTRDLFETDNDLLSSVIEQKGNGQPHKVLVYIDSGVVEAIPGIVERIVDHIRAHADTMELAGVPQVVPGGEQAKKGWNTIRQIMEAIGDGHLCRHSFVIAVGGGSVLDMVGFAASLVHRGLRCIRVPTTVLAQNDAGVGVKTGMDEHGQKNYVGTFAPPYAVLIDNDFLRTLDNKYWIGGVSEAFKVAIIKDASFFDYLCDHATDLRARDEDIIEEVVKRCAVLHLDHIRTTGDPFEFGVARPLDFGHWSAHRLEVMSDYEIGHGQAVAVGIAIDTCYAAATGFITEAERDRVLGALDACGLPTWNQHLASTSGKGRLEILQGLEDFREHLGGELHVTLPHGIGSKQEVTEMDLSLIEAAIAFLKTR